MTRPFEGVKILDFTQVLAGPYASYQLALLGADVIKVERREGEDMRRTPLSSEWAKRGLPGHQRQQAQPDARPAKAGCSLRSLVRDDSVLCGCEQREIGSNS